MGKNHIVLSEETFKNSIYIKTINQMYDETNDFKKEDNKQFNMILDIYNTFIKLNNCFFSDSNLSNMNKLDNATEILETLYKVNDEEDGFIGVKYTVRDIKDICDKHCRYLYNLMGKIYIDLGEISRNEEDITKALKKVKELIEEEMNLLEYSEFDNNVLNNIQYKKNNIKYYRTYVKYISKFDDIYNDKNNFIISFKNEFNSLYDIELNDNEINKHSLLFKLLTSINNGLINVITDYKIDNCNLTQYSDSTELYKYYLKTLDIDYESNKFIDYSKDYFLLFGIVRNKVDSIVKNNQTLLEKFDIYFFYLTMEQTIYSHKLKFKNNSNYINKIIDDLISIYKDLVEIRSNEKELLEQNLIKEKFINLYNKVNILIKRYSNIFEKIS